MNAQSIAQCRWQLSDLLKDWVKVDCQDDVLVTGVSQHSGDTSRGDLFLATAGVSGHGLQYCADAISNGASAIAWEPSIEKFDRPPKYSIPAIEFKQLSQHVGDIASRCYGDICAHINTIAITGTDGKSSVAHLTAQALEQLSEPCGLVGTLGYGRLTDLAEATHTTPPVTRMAKEFARIAQQGCNYVALEASSHGIAQGRLQNLNINTAVLTNITRDHLDYHGSLEDYIQAKAKLFFDLEPGHIVLNYDDAIGRKWIKELHKTSNVITYSLNDSAADIYATNIEYIDEGIRLDLHLKGDSQRINLSLLGEFNILNMLAVAAVLLSIGKSTAQIFRAVQKIQAVPGRMQIIKNSHSPAVIIDYAHTPAALSAAISAVKKHVAGNLICVFGCGGNRDTGKRAEMGAVATNNADYTIITSDNPRTEEPRQIIEQIVAGCKSAADYEIRVNRKEAIASAIERAEKKDAVLIAGKGHEKYQQIGADKFKFDDVEVAAEVLRTIV